MRSLAPLKCSFSEGGRWGWKVRSWRSFGPRSRHIVMLHDDNILSLPLTEPSFSTALGWAPSLAQSSFLGTFLASCSGTKAISVRAHETDLQAVLYGTESGILLL